jgi:hypothetical protein
MDPNEYCACLGKEQKYAGWIKHGADKCLRFRINYYGSTIEDGRKHAIFYISKIRIDEEHDFASEEYTRTAMAEDYCDKCKSIGKWHIRCYTTKQYEFRVMCDDDPHRDAGRMKPKKRKHRKHYNSIVTMISDDVFHLPHVLDVAEAYRKRRNRILLNHALVLNKLGAFGLSSDLIPTILEYI